VDFHVHALTGEVGNSTAVVRYRELLDADGVSLGKTVTRSSIAYRVRQKPCQRGQRNPLKRLVSEGPFLTGRIESFLQRPSPSKMSLMHEGKISYCVLRPLSTWPYQKPKRLSLRVWVTSKPQLAGKSGLLEWAMSGREVEDLERRPNWLCCEYRDHAVAGSKRQTRAIQLISNAALAVQIVAPTGSWEAQIITFEKQNGGLVPKGVVHHQPQNTTKWARIVGFDSRAEADLPLVVAGVQRATSRGGVRLINALNFFQLGLESTNPYLQFFLWTTAIDDLVMAVSRINFQNRLCNLFGESNFVLPSIEFGQPKYRVQDVADDIFELRSEIAHGQEIRAKFRAVGPFEDDTGKDIAVVAGSRVYSEVLHECSLFLLCRLMRWLFVQGLDDKVRDTTTWKRIIDQPRPSIP
jgi:hypothetical protein